MLKYLKQKDGDTCKSHVSENEQVTHTPPDVDELLTIPKVQSTVTVILKISK